MNNFVINYVNNLINNEVLKFKNAKRPFRMTMIYAEKCYICEGYNKDIYETTTDDFLGIFYRIGWRYCKKCENIQEYSEKKYYENMNHLTYTKCEILTKNKYSFLRISKKKGIKSYIQNNSNCEKENGNILSIYKKRIVMAISWLEKEQKLCKCVPLANLIFFNPKIFKNNIKYFPIKQLNKKWSILINEEYNIYKKIIILFNYFYKNNFSETIPKIILSYCGSFIL